MVVMYTREQKNILIYYPSSSVKGLKWSSATISLERILEQLQRR